MSKQQDRKPSERLRCIHCFDNPNHDGQCEFVGREEYKRRIRGDEKDMV